LLVEVEVEQLPCGSGGGGGGAGGFRESQELSGCYSVAGPLVMYKSLPVSVQAYPITVGAGAAGVGPATFKRNLPGSNSIFSTITSAGGGGGGNRTLSPGYCLMVVQVVVEDIIQFLQVLQVILHQLVHLKEIQVECKLQITLMQVEEVVEQLQQVQNSNW
jgi:hypothetical protein